MLDLRPSRDAESDLTSALQYLEQHSPAAAERLIELHTQRCEQLRTLPLIGRTRDDLGPGLRSVVVGDYLLFYRVTDTAVEVVRFLHGRRDLGAAFSTP